jgi:hypothetical protein
MEERKFKLKQHVWCNNQQHKSEVGVIAEFEEDDIEGQRSYMVMLHDKKGKMYFEEFLESELELVHY